MSATPKEAWGLGGPYEQYVGRWSRVVAREFLDWLAIPAEASWVDVGCGTGALTESILTRCAPKEVIGIDQSEGFIAEARRHTDDARVRFQVGDATNLPLDTATYNATVSGLVLNFVVDHTAMVREMVRVTKPGGKVAVYVWDYAEGMAMMRHFWDVAFTINPHDAQLDEATRFPLCQPTPLATLWHDLGLTAVSVRPIDIPTVFQSFADYWSPFLGKQGAAPTYLASLDAETQQHIRTILQSRLVSAQDGTIALTARAWAVQGTVQG